MDKNDVALHKAILWEEAKGKLRAMIVADGHKRVVAQHDTLDADKATHKAWTKRQAIVEDFISSFEDRGLHE